jgi:drug/metabolite transporter (DMT)-like permease
MRPRSLLPHVPGLAFIAAVLGFGVANVLSKVILERGVGPLELLPIRYLFALISLLALLAATGRLKALNADTWIKGSWLGIISMAVPSILLTVGLTHLTASASALLVGLLPLTTVVFAHHLIDGEKMHRGLYPGFLLALIGTALLVDGGGDPAAKPFLGFTLVGLGVIAAGAGGALTRRFAIGTPAADLIVPQFLSGASLVLLTSLLTGSLGGIGRMDRGSWALIALLGTCATTLPFGALLWLSELTTAARVALTAYLVPLVGLAGGVVILDEPLGVRLLVGGALILAGVVLADRAERRVHPLTAAFAEGLGVPRP